jgi:DNA-binding LacI/PurR family transcriptional regulator
MSTVDGSSVTRRVTIADVAKQAGLSKGAVSYALNGQPGVSEETRQRVLRLALEMGWHPNSAAKALSGARAGAFGLVLARPAHTLGVEPFFMKLISGMESAMASSQTALLLQVVPDHDAEIATYRRWWAERRVDGVFLIDLCRDDKRVPVLEELRLPAMVVGGPGHHGTLPGVWIDDAGAMAMVMEYLAALRHRRIARVGGVPGMLHTEMRTEAFETVAARLGLAWSTTISTDYTPEQGAQVTRRLLSSSSPPTAIIYDNDVMAVAGVSVAHEMGVHVPSDVSIMAWDDSVLCEITHPPLTAVSRDITAYGVQVASNLLALLTGEVVTETEEDPPRLVVRGSTARPNGRTGATP